VTGRIRKGVGGRMQEEKKEQGIRGRLGIMDQKWIRGG